ncbi:B9 domain-containing protein 2 [Sparganum proliferum]
MAEVHIIGQIISASNFPEKSLFCKWGISAGSAWRLLSGPSEGQTQVDNPSFGEKAYFCHPFDLHFATKGIQGWPKFFFQVWHHDWLGRNELFGYGFCHVPSTAGSHELEVVTWRPCGSFAEQFKSQLVGGAAHLCNLDLVFNQQNRYMLQTESMGKLQLVCNIITRNFEKFGVEM